jgi:hypothetical protein
MLRLAVSLTGCVLTLTCAYAQQGAATGASQPPVTGQLLNDGFEVKAVINNTYLILQKGNRAYWCGSTDSGLTWANWPQLTRDASCTSLNK